MRPRMQTRPDLLFLLTASAAAPRRAFALPANVSYTPAGTAITYVPLIVVSISLFLVVFVFLAIKLLYVEQRRLATIHAPHGTTTTIALPTGGGSTASFSKRENRYRPILVGFLGSPAWETNLASKLTRMTWRRGGGERRRGYSATTARSTRSHKNSTLGSSRLTASSSTLCCTTDPVNPPFPVARWSTGSSRIPRSSIGKTSGGTSTTRFQNFCYGDFGEVRSPGGAGQGGMRRASPCSIRLVDGPTLSNPVQFSFLAGRPPHASVSVSSPLMGTRDSFQLSRCSLRCERGRPAPPLPSLPSFFPFRMSNAADTGGGGLEATEYLPSLRFSPLASVAKVFYSQQQALEERGVPLASTCLLASDGLTNHRVVCGTAPLRPNKTNVDRCKGLAIAGSSSTLLNEDVRALPWSSSKEERRGDVLPGSSSVSESSRLGGDVSKKPLKSCLRRSSVAPTMASISTSPDATLTPWMSETTARTSTRSMGDQSSLRTPVFEVDVGMLGLDRFCWNEDVRELKVQSCHMKKDSIALVPVWE